jgi:hypothetical protein
VTTKPIIDAVLKAYKQTKPHLMEELPDRTPVQVLVVFTLGDLRRLEQSGGTHLTLLSGG